MYTASKAAMHAIAETLAVEIEPFGVSQGLARPQPLFLTPGLLPQIQSLVVRLGAVISNIATNGEHNLPLSLRSSPSPSVPSTLYTAYLPAIRARLALSQTDPSALPARIAADAIVARVFAGYRPAGAGVSLAERVRGWVGMAAHVDRGRQRFRGGTMLLGRIAWLLWIVRMVLPREMGLRFVAKKIMGAGAVSKKRD